MDRKLVVWARMVKSRSRRLHTRGHPITPLWLFTDDRLADPEAAIRAMAAHRPGLFGVVLRARTDTARRQLGTRLAPLCRRARIPLLVAGDVRLTHTLRAGLHLPAGRHSGRLRPVSASAHNAIELREAARAGARLVFLSPVFPTASHPGARALGPVRASRLARTAPPGVQVLALGGIDGRTARALPRAFTGAGAVGALSP